MLTANEALRDSLTRHQIYVLRYGGGVRNRVNKLLSDTETTIAERIRGKLSGHKGLTSAADTRRMEAINNTVREIRAEAWGKADELLRDEMTSLAIAEPASLSATFASASPVVLDLSSPAPALLRSIVTSRPFQGRVLREWAAKMADDDIRAIQNQIRVGMVSGDPAAVIVRRIIGTAQANGADGITELSRAQVNSVVRTAVMHITSEARKEFALENSDIISKELYVATLDHVTCLQCAPIDGEIYDVGMGPHPPIHISCFTGDTMISTCSSVSNLYKRRYKGAAVNITTKAGRTLCVTPNHPILTLRGWVAAGDIDRSDKLIPVDALKINVNEHYEDSVDAEFADLFGAVNVSLNPALIANRPTTAEDFHGDGIADSEVDIVSTDGLRWRNVVEMLGQCGKHEGLGFRSAVNPAFVPFRCLTPLFLTANAASHSLMGALGKVRDLLRSGASHAGELLFRAAAQGFAALNENPGYSPLGALDAEMYRYPGGANARPVSGDDSVLFRFGEVDELDGLDGDSSRFQDPSNDAIADSHEFANPLDSHLFDCSKADDVVDLFVSEIDTHVYNLENKDNWYVANGIIAHNCRCIRVPTIDPAFGAERPNKPVTERMLVREYADQNGLGNISDRDRLPRGTKGDFDKFARKRTRELVGPIPASTSYQVWLKSQSAEFQDDVLGKAKGKLFRDGGLSLDKFTHRNGDELTLDELRVRQKAAFEAANL